MMRQYDLIERVRRYNPNTDEALLNRAYVYAMKAHGEQKRASGDPYFSHPLEVAAILTDLKLDDATIAAALLHDTIEDTPTTRAEIDQLFGHDIGTLVEGLTKLKKLDLVTKRGQAGRKPAQAPARHRRRRARAAGQARRPAAQHAHARAHAAGRTRSASPRRRSTSMRRSPAAWACRSCARSSRTWRSASSIPSLPASSPSGSTALADRNSDLIAEIEQQLTRKLADSRHRRARSRAGASGPIRSGARWSASRSASSSSPTFSASASSSRRCAECYRALGIVHTTWPVVPGRFKDYVSTPKQNDYRSIHTTVIGPGKQRVELQIRTADMHEIAEYGIAAHALYKDGEGSPTEMLSRESNAYAWLRRTIELLAEGSNPEEFLEHTKLELFHDQVFCFTPKGKLIALPRKATPIDFAYAVHTDVGNTAVGCKINGKIAPLVSELSNGDEVEIITSKAQTAPPAAWESIVVTGKARAGDPRAPRATPCARNMPALGRRIVERLFQRAKSEYSDEKLHGALPRLARASIEDVMAAVGRGEMQPSDVARAMYPDYKEERVAAVPPPKADERLVRAARRAKAVKFKVPTATDRGAIPIRGINTDLPVRFAPNGGAVPGDRIVGILTPGEGITIYPIQSPALKEFEDTPERWLDVRWDMDERNPQRFPARIAVQSVNEPGTLAQIAQVIAEHDGNIDNIRMTRRSPDFTDCTIDLEVYDLKHLNAIIAQLRAKTVVANAERVTAER